MFIIASVLMFLILFFGYHFIRFRNPYKLIMVFGKKGSGKSTLLTKLSLKYGKKGRPVYSNVPVCGAYLYDTSAIGRISFPEGAVIFVDEVGMIWDNRNFKNFNNSVRDYFKLQRHYKHTVYLFSQSFDIDKKLRDLTDNMYLITNVFNAFSVARRITKSITISHGDKNSTGESRLIDDMHFDSILLAPFGGIRITYLPKYAKYFDSFEAPVLQDGEFPRIPMPEFPSFRDNIKAMAAGRYAACRLALQSVLKWNRKG